MRDRKMGTALELELAQNINFNFELYNHGELSRENFIKYSMILVRQIRTAEPPYNAMASKLIEKIEHGDEAFEDIVEFHGFVIRDYYRIKVRNGPSGPSFLLR